MISVERNDSNSFDSSPPSRSWCSRLTLGFSSGEPDSSTGVPTKALYLASIRRIDPINSDLSWMKSTITNRVCSSM